MASFGDKNVANKKQILNKSLIEGKVLHPSNKEVSKIVTHIHTHLIMNRKLVFVDSNLVLAHT